MNRIISKFASRVALLLVSSITGCTAARLENHVFVYKQEQIIAYLRPYGFSSDSIYDSWQNVSGTRVYFLEPRNGGPDVVWVIDQHHETPFRIEAPNNHYWIRDDNQATSLPPFVDEARGVGIDHQSGYFISEVDHILKIGNINSPGGWLAEVPNDPKEEFWPYQICASGGRIVLLAVRDWNTEAFPEYHLNCWIIDKGNGNPGGLRKRERRLDGYAICVSPLSGQILCCTYGNLPMPSFLFLYDVESGKRTELGLADGGAFVLPTDFITPRLEGKKPKW